MTQHLVRYTVKPDEAGHNEELVRAVFAELDDVQPTGLRFAAYRLDDGVSFVHLICSDTVKGKSPVSQLQALSAFHLGIRERCDEPPVRAKLSELGSFRMFGKGER